MNTLQAITGARVYLHSDPAGFTTTKSIGIVCVTVGSIALLVIGILAITNGMMSAAGAYALIGVGGTAVLVDIVVVMVFDSQHHKAMKLLNDYVRVQISHPEPKQWWSQRFNVLEASSDAFVEKIKYYNWKNDCDEDNKFYYILAIREKNAKLIHIYLNEEELNNKITWLDKQGFAEVIT